MGRKGQLTFFFNEINHLERFSKAQTDAKALQKQVLTTGYESDA